MIKTIGSICSGIEAASVAWNSFDVSFEWFSEIAPFPSALLAEKYAATPNLGDMTTIPEMISSGKITAPDMICGGTPCQAFSLAGFQNGLHDSRGNLTLKFVDIIEANDTARIQQGKNRSTVFWENVEGVLTDKTNAFGCLISSLAGLAEVLTISNNKWPTAGIVRGKKRNVAWRVLDAKFFGVPQQRRRLYLLAGGSDTKPENVLFEIHNNKLAKYPTSDLVFKKDGHRFEIFREYTDCLYAAYGTKWSGNAAAYNGSLFIVQDNRIRRLSPLETERLMGFPDDYTNLPIAKNTNRYQATGNSWAVPVVRWIGQRLINNSQETISFDMQSLEMLKRCIPVSDSECFINLGKNEVIDFGNGVVINCSYSPEHPTYKSMKDIVSANTPEDIYISPVGCAGIVRRKQERNLKINTRLEEVLLSIASQLSSEEIEKRSRIQPRGQFSRVCTKVPSES